MIFQGVVKGGKLILEKSGRLKKFKDGQRVECTIWPLHKTRSLPQNSYYWGVLVKVVSEETGYYPNEIHAYHKEKLWIFPPIKHNIMGEEVYEVRTTTTLSTKEFAEWNDYLRQFWAEREIYIPLPNEIPIEFYD